MEAYLEKRRKLILEDRAQRIDYSDDVHPSSVETQADRIVRNIRTEEATSIWGVGSMDIRQHKPGDVATDLFPGMAFLTGFFCFSGFPRGDRVLMQSSKLDKPSCKPSFLASFRRSFTEMHVIESQFY